MCVCVVCVVCVVILSSHNNLPFSGHAWGKWYELLYVFAPSFIAQYERKNTLVFCKASCQMTAADVRTFTFSFIFFNVFLGFFVSSSLLFTSLFVFRLLILCSLYFHLILFSDQQSYWYSIHYSHQPNDVCCCRYFRIPYSCGYFGKSVLRS